MPKFALGQPQEVLDVAAAESGSEFIISLECSRRSDGSVMVNSPDLPLFSVVGENEQAAYDIAMQIIPQYLHKNVPDFVDLRPVSRAGTIFSKEEHLLPAHIIARTGDHRDGARPDTA